MNALLGPRGLYRYILGDHSELGGKGPIRQGGHVAGLGLIPILQPPCNLLLGEASLRANLIYVAVKTFGNPVLDDFVPVHYPYHPTVLNQHAAPNANGLVQNKYYAKCFLARST